MTDTLYQELEQTAKMSGWTTTAVLEAALRRYFAELREDAEDAACVLFAHLILYNSTQAAECGREGSVFPISKKYSCGRFLRLKKDAERFLCC